MFWSGNRESPADARAYAEETLRRLLIAHDAKYFAANLSPRERADFPPNMRERIVAGLTKIGVPDGPIQIVNMRSARASEREDDLRLGFDANASYPAVNAKFYLQVRCHAAIWRIDFFSVAWMNKEAASPAVAP